MGRSDASADAGLEGARAAAKRLAIIKHAQLTGSLNAVILRAMFFKALLAAGFYFAASPSPMSHAAPPVQRTDAAVSSWVRPLIGTKATRKGYGGTIPAVTRPFGMTHWTPATRVGAVGKLPYWWHDKSIIGFKGTHQPAPWMGDYGYVSLMPGVGTVTPGKSLPFLHAEETARIGRYDVRLVDQGKPIDVSVTATERVG